MGQGPIFGNSKRFTIHEDLSKNWDGQKNLGDRNLRSSLFANKKDGDLNSEELEVINAFADWCAKNQINLNFSLQERVGDEYSKLAGCTLFSNAE